MKSAPIDLCRRLELFGITDATKSTLEPLLPFVSRELDIILHESYRTMRANPLIERRLAGVDQSRLIQKQRAHWMTLLSCEWDQSYLHRVIGIGSAHVQSGGVPSLYAAGYGVIHQGLLRCAVRAFAQSDALAGILCALNRVVAMDQDMVMSYHMREYWKQAALRQIGDVPEPLDEPSDVPEPVVPMEDPDVVYL